MIDPSDVKRVEGKSGYAPLHGLGTVGAHASNSVATANSNSGTKVEPFVSETKYAIPHDPAVTWESVVGTAFKVELGYYVYDIVSPPASNVNPSPTATADVRPRNVLTVVEAECEGDGCVCDQHGSISLKNAKRYYLGPTATETNGELVGIVASANPGHVLKEFRVMGGGNVYKWIGHGQVEDFTSLEDMELVTANEDGLYVGDDLHLEMASDATVTPVVCLCSHEGTDHDGWLEGDTSFGAMTPGIGRYGYRDPVGDDFGCLHYIHQKLKDAGESWHALHEDRLIVTL